MLRVEHLTAGYGPVTVLHDVSLTVPTGGARTVTGPNGAGKTTLLHTIAGLIPARAGTIHHHGRALHSQPAHRVARAGVALVPQGRRVFASLTVTEHLAVAARRRRGPWTVQRILDALPGLTRLRNRYGRQLSGGEQQLLAIARALATNPTLLLLDEPTEGLAPALAATITTLIPTITDQGTSVLLAAPSTDGSGTPAHTTVRLQPGRVSDPRQPATT